MHIFDVSDVPMSEVDGELMEELISAESKCNLKLIPCSDKITSVSLL
jgi:hypothetical protein